MKKYRLIAGWLFFPALPIAFVWAAILNRHDLANPNWVLPDYRMIILYVIIALELNFVIPTVIIESRDRRWRRLRP